MKTPRKSVQKNRSAGQKKAEILESILLQVPFDGWTKEAIMAGAKAAKASVAEVDSLFPNGVHDVIAAFHDAIDAAMFERTKAERGFARLRVREKVGFAVRARLEYLAPHREAMKRLLAWYALPTRVAVGVRSLAQAADTIWQAAGDTSTDYNFYTKRVLLGAVMKATLLFWLNDASEDHKATWEFLDRRLSEVVRAGKALSLAREWTPSEMVKMIRSRVMKG